MSPGSSLGMIVPVFQTSHAARAGQGMASWSSCGLLAQLWTPGWASLLSSARLTCAAISLTAVNEAVGLVFNNFSQSSYSAF